MKAEMINALATYENRDPRLGDAVTDTGEVFLAQIAIFGEECDGTEDWDLEEFQD